MGKNKLSIAFNIIKIIILAVLVLSFAFFLYLMIDAKIALAQTESNGWEALGIAIALVLGAYVNGAVSIFSLVWLIVAICSKNKLLKVEAGEITEEQQALQVVRKKDVKHFILLTLLPIALFILILVVAVI